jgi:hypothetical protein
MLLLNTLALAVLCGFALARADSSKCSAELQGILYEPLTYGKDYMTKVAAEFNKGKALLFTAQADSYIAKFEQQWGVTVNTKSPLNICSAYVTNTIITSIPVSFNNSIFDYSFSIPASEAFIIENLTIAVTGNTGGNRGLGRYILTPPSSIGPSIALSEINFCLWSSTNGPFSLGFADGATGVIECTAQNAGTVVAPYEPLSQLNGQNSTGEWVLNAVNGEGLSVYTITLTNSQSNYTNSCSRDVMKALTNIPGYRYDRNEQTAYYTEDVFDANGNFKQVTISRPISGMIVKK